MNRPLATENTHTPEIMRRGIVCCRYTVPVCVCVCVCAWSTETYNLPSTNPKAKNMKGRKMLNALFAPLASSVAIRVNRLGCLRETFFAPKIAYENEPLRVSIELTDVLYSLHLYVSKVTYTCSRTNDMHEIH